MSIRLLNPTLINQIAAGEVIERPASAVKELVENAIDAGASHITVRIRDGGRTYISVADNGYGMSKDDLEICIERHATSKLPDNDLFNISTLGFRGEALPSIGAVSRLSITTKQVDSDNAWMLNIEGGAKHSVQPVSYATKGTKIEIKDLFYATPARLNFLKSSGAERGRIVAILHKIALANSNITFDFYDDQREVFSLPAGNLVERVCQVLGQEFSDNSIEVKAERGEIKLSGWLSLPTYHKRNTQDQYLFVNGRCVTDKVLASAIRVGYQDVLAPQRYPALCLFLQIPSEELDVNVHPAKTEVRFRDQESVRRLVISALRTTFMAQAPTANKAIAERALSAFQASTPLASVPIQNLMPFSPKAVSSGSGFSAKSATAIASQVLPTQEAITTEKLNEIGNSNSFIQAAPQTTQVAILKEQDNLNTQLPLGAAKAQIHDTYIVSTTGEHLIIVDQHAAHERLIYEKFKSQYQSSGVPRQALLIPEIIELNEAKVEQILSTKSDLAKFGLIIERFSTTAILVREMPALLKKECVQKLIEDIAADLAEHNQGISLEESYHEILSTLACHNSIRAGRKLSIDEMNAMLRQMEITPKSSQCNHGRPTFIKLPKIDIEKLFGRR